jgi:nitroimidazol reductase NimA-like FMN-containing flavoprotein (pyridoxamine 5'-phosphate oxidase superfamily)
MKSIFEIKDKATIEDLLNTTEYGTLALCADNKPYSLPINFVQLDDAIYFHGSKKGRKIEILKENTLASFSVVKAHALIPSYFSSHEALACPATQFFQSIMIDGEIVFVEDYTEKMRMLDALMVKLQPEGEYKPFSDKAYETAINATTIYKLIPKETRAKYKFGQHLSQERFAMIISHLKRRNTPIDKETINQMEHYHDSL